MRFLPSKTCENASYQMLRSVLAKQRGVTWLQPWSCAPAGETKHLANSHTFLTYMHYPQTPAMKLEIQILHIPLSSEHTCDPSPPHLPTAPSLGSPSPTPCPSSPSPSPSTYSPSAAPNSSSSPSVAAGS